MIRHTWATMLLALCCTCGCKKSNKGDDQPTVPNVPIVQRQPSTIPAFDGSSKNVWTARGGVVSRLELDRAWSIRAVSPFDQMPKAIPLLSMRIMADKSPTAPFPDMDGGFALELTGKVLTESWLANVRNLAHVQAITLRCEEIEGDALKHLAGLKQLQSLQLGGSRLAVSTLSSLAGSNITSLFINSPATTDEHIAMLGSLPQLRVLEIATSSVSAQNFPGIRSLKTLKLATNVKPAGIRGLKSLPNLQSLTVMLSQLDPDAAKALNELTTLKHLKLSSYTLMPPALAELGSHPSLESLDISMAALDDTNMSVFKSLPRIRELKLIGRITDVGLIELAALSNLESLEIQSNEITDKGIERLSSNKKLKSLSTNGDITDAGLKSIGTMRQLESLNLSLGRTTASGLRELKALPNLRELTISWSTNGDAMMKDLNSLTTLRRLHLNMLKLSDKGVEQLQDLRHLESLSIATNPIVHANELKLAKTLPNCRITTGVSYNADQFPNRY